MAGKERVLSEVWLPVLKNSNTRANIDAVLFSLAVDARLEGFCEEPQRCWMEVCSDLGAEDFELFDGKDGIRATAKYGNFRFRFPIGHEGMALMAVVLKLLLEHGYDVLGPCYNFNSPRQKEILFDGFDNHKCNEFILDLCRPVITDKFIEEYMDSLLRNQHLRDCVLGFHPLIMTWRIIYISVVTSFLQLTCSQLMLVFDVEATGVSIPSTRWEERCCCHFLEF
jgi:hypothetical protein